MTQILKVRAYLMQNFMELDTKKFSDHKALTFVGSMSQLLWPEMALFSKKALHNIEKHS